MTALAISQLGFNSFFFIGFYLHSTSARIVLWVYIYNSTVRCEFVFTILFDFSSLRFMSLYLKVTIQRPLAPVHEYFFYILHLLSAPITVWDYLHFHSFTSVRFDLWVCTCNSLFDFRSLCFINKVLVLILQFDFS